MNHKKIVKNIHRHIKHHHKKYFLGAGIGFLIFKLATILVGSFGFIGNNFSRAEWIEGKWNNDVFVDKTFWDGIPDNTEIVGAFFGNTIGDQTVYTQNWNNNDCDPSLIQYMPLSPGEDTLPDLLDSNTIYVLESGNYTIRYEQGILANGSGCIGIVGKGNVRITSKLQISSDGIINFENQGNIIIDNIKIDGSSDGGGATHDNNIYGLKFFYTPNVSINKAEIFNTFYGIGLNSSPNSLVNESILYDNNDGIYLEYSPDSITNNNELFDNTHGIYLGYSDRSNIYNSKIYNNNAGLDIFSSNIDTNNCQIFNNLYGVWDLGTGYNSINNSQIYNNDFGLYYISSSNNVINNSQIYNNNNGTYLSGSDNNKIHNSWYYNNYYGFFLTNSSNNKYYGYLNTFYNDTDRNGTGIYEGLGNEVSSLGWTDGNIDDLFDMSRDYITNPMQNDGEYMLGRNLDFNSMRGDVSTYVGSGKKYSYGSGILSQSESVIYDGNELIIGAYIFDANKYIGSQLDKKQGNLVGFDGNISITNIVVTGSSVSPISKYSLFGDIENYIYGQAINTPTGVILIGGEGTKKIITQIYNDSDYFASHFEKLANLGLDSIPNQFTFINKTGAELNTLYTSNIVTITGMSPGLFTGISIDNGNLFKNGLNIGTSGTGGNGDQIILALTSSNNYSTTGYSVLNIGGVTGSFVITTKDIPGAPTILGAINGSYYSGNISIQISGTDYSGTLVNGVWDIQDSFVLSGIDNSITQYYLTAYNTAGNYSTIRFTIDKQAPQNLGFNINNGAIYTTGVNITLTNITGTDSRGPMQIAYGTSQTVSNRSLRSASKSFILPNIDGEYTIYMRFRDGGGNISITSGSIILDANAPIITINNPNTNYENFKTITASTNEGILTMTTGSTNTTCDASRNFIAYSGITFTSESDNGKYVCYRAIDSGGNITYSLSNIISGIDTTMPVASIISPSSIAGETGIFISVNSNENSQCRYGTSIVAGFSGMILLNGDELSHTGYYTANEGLNTLYFICKDIAGNTSDAMESIFTVNLGAPVIQFVLGTTPNNPTNSNSVNIYLTGADINKYKYKLITGYSCDGIVYDGGEININTSITQGPTMSDQTYSYCAIGYKTGLNVWQITGTKYTFVYDNTSPVITVNDGVNTNWNTGDNINLSVNYNLAGASGTKYIYSDTGMCDLLDYSYGTIYSGGNDILINNEDYNGKYLCFRSIDLAGNVSYTGMGLLKIDKTSPTTNISDTGNNRINANINFILSCNDGTGVGCQTTYYKILTGETSCNEGNYIEYTTGVNIDISTGTTEIKTVCYYGVDDLGNTEGYKKQLYKIDKQGPSINLISPFSGGITGSGTSVNFVWSGIDAGVGISGGYNFKLYNSTGNLITGININNTNLIVYNLLNGIYSWKVEAIDGLGNIGISNTQSFTNINQYVILSTNYGIPEFISEFTGKGYVLGTGSSLYTTGNYTGVLVGINPIYFGYNNEIKVPLIISSTGSLDRIEIKIESGTFITETGTNAASCENFILTPAFVSNTLANTLSGNQKIFSTFMLGNNCPNVSLQFKNTSGSNKNISIRIRSRELEEGTYKIWYSENGIDWIFLDTSDYKNNVLEFISNHMTYFAISKDKQTSSAGGGGIKLIKDDCKYSSQKKNLPGANEKGIDYSDSYYDKDCRGNQHGITLDGDISGSQFSDELNYAYLYAYQIGATTMPHINQADMMGSLIRKHMAKMISNYAINEMGMNPDENKNCNFGDINNESAEMGYYMNLACQLGLMGLKSDGTPDTKFNPNAVVTRSQFGTALSRLLYGEEFNVGRNEVWYSKHLNNLKSKNIMNKIDNPESYEKRGYVMLMLMRAKTLR